MRYKARRRAYPRTFASTRSRGDTAWNPVKKIEREPGIFVKRPLRLNQVIPQQQRVFLPLAYGGTLVTNIGTADTFGLAEFIAPTVAGQSTTTYHQMQTFDTTSTASLGQPFGHDRMYTMYDSSMNIGVRYELDILSAVGGAVTAVAFADRTASLIQNINGDFFLPPHAATSMTYRKHRTLAVPTTDGGKAYRNFLTGYISSKVMFNKSDKVRFHTDDPTTQFRESSGAPPTSSGAMTFGFVNSNPGGHTVTVEYCLRLFWDQVFFDRQEIDAG